jgi:hypothetical protein
MASDYIQLTGDEPQSFLQKIRENKKHFDEVNARYVDQKIKELLSADIDQTALKYDTNLLIATIEEKSKLGCNIWNMKLAPDETGGFKCQQAAGAIMTKYHSDNQLTKNQVFIRAFSKYLRKIYTIMIMNASQKTGIPVHETYQPKEQKEGMHLHLQDGYFYLHIWF